MPSTPPSPPEVCDRLLLVTLAIHEAAAEDNWSEFEILMSERDRLIDQAALAAVAPESLEPVRAAEAKLQRLLVARRAHLLDSIEQGMRARHVASAYRPAEEVRGWDQLG